MLHKRFPFEWTNPIGYLVAVIIEYVIVGYEFSVDASVLALGIGAYWIGLAAIKEIQSILHTIKKRVQAKKHQSNRELKMLFTEFIELHGVAKQLSIKINIKIV